MAGVHGLCALEKMAADGSMMRRGEGGREGAPQACRSNDTPYDTLWGGNTTRPTTRPPPNRPPSHPPAVAGYSRSAARQTRRYIYRCEASSRAPAAAGWRVREESRLLLPLASPRQGRAAPSGVSPLRADQAQSEASGERQRARLPTSSEPGETGEGCKRLGRSQSREGRPGSAPPSPKRMRKDEGTAVGAPD